MADINWRAFWASFATIFIALIIFAIVIDPLVKKYKIMVVNPNKDLEDKIDALTKAKTTA
jgi:cell division protein FtsW (lipid II flippase)